MIRTGYDAKLSAGAITAGGTLGILIPPSVMLIVMGPVLGVSVADLYAAAFGPGFMLAGIYLTLPAHPLLPESEARACRCRNAERVHSIGTLLCEVVIGVVPLLLLIAATLGSILGGPRDADRGIRRSARWARSCSRWLYRKLNYAGLKQRSALDDGDLEHGAAPRRHVEHLRRGVLAAGHGELDHGNMLALPLPPMAMLVVVIVLIFLLGWPFEWPAIVLVFLPIFYPVVAALKFDMVWFGALVAVTLQTAYLSPPVAMSAYYLKQVVKEWSLGTIYKGMFEFMMLQCIAIALLVMFPQIATYLPEQLRAEIAAVKSEQVDDSQNRLEEDPLKAQQQAPETEEEKDTGPKEKR